MSPSTISLLDAIKGRSSLHTLSDDVDIPDSRVQEIVREGILHSPTPFNCQSGRAVVLVKAEHKKFWDLAHESAKSKVPAAVFEKVFAPRIKMFRAAYGTVSPTKALTRRLFLMCLCAQILFYESGNAMQAVCDRMPIVKDKMPQWTEHASGMLQYTIWTMLTAEGFGHYNPMVDAAAAKEWDIPTDWSLNAQMVFGKPTGPRFAEKEYSPVEDRMKVYGA
ncbi:fatty acid repression mutant protein [Rutstroemia sp. NJR-2017a BBW]|nr:fatty acid repression mutant protein [Rutstroemia sp. NJR-2017a BBW]